MPALTQVMIARHMTAEPASSFVHVRERFTCADEAWRAAGRLVDGSIGDGGPLHVLGDFVIPPAGGPPSRDFQTLHVDFGLPLAPRAPADVARFTALYVMADAPPSGAVTRLVPLAAVFGSGTWPQHDELLRRFARYGESHGAWDPKAGYIEGSFARIVEAARGEAPVLPSVTTHPGFLCGMEFASYAEEVKFFRERGLDPESVAIDIALRPGELLLFDNLSFAHGRRGSRQPGELRQRVFGHPALPVEELIRVRDRVLGAFAG